MVHDVNSDDPRNHEDYKKIITKLMQIHKQVALKCQDTCGIN
jgi:hypothetical protein